MHLHDYIIINQNKQDNSSLCTILDYHPPKVCCRYLYKTLPHLTINTTSSNKKINTTSRSGNQDNIDQVMIGIVSSSVLNMNIGC